MRTVLGTHVYTQSQIEENHLLFNAAGKVLNKTVIP
jgi:hypothetical protein